MTKTAVLYARISVSVEESVSVVRQITSATKYAEARGWGVVGTFVDDGVSATHNKPENRAGWKSLLESPGHFDAVIIWKVDRLARRVIDFLHADEMLQARNAAIVCVEQSIDMTTGEGRAFAQMLAVFGELESAAISSRIAAARVHLIQAGRVPSGHPPYGWMTIANPNGPGYVLAKDPKRIKWVRGMVDRLLAGETITSITRWLDTKRAPFAPGHQVIRTNANWQYSSVHRLLSNPLLAGMVLFNPGDRSRGRTRDVLRHTDGTPVIHANLAIISQAEREAVLSIMEATSTAWDASRRVRDTSTPIVVGLATCGACERDLPMKQGSDQGRMSLRCPRCRQVISVLTLAAYLERALLTERGHLPMYRSEPSPPADPAAFERLSRIEAAIRSTALELAEDRPDTTAVAAEILRLKTIRSRQRKAIRDSEPNLIDLGLTVENIWLRCQTDAQRHNLLRGQIEHLDIYRGGGGPYLDPARVDLRWGSETGLVAPTDIIDNDEKPAAVEEWVSFRAAVELLDIDQDAVRRAVRDGRIEQRDTTHRNYPSLSKTSVLAFGASGEFPAAAPARPL